MQQSKRGTSWEGFSFWPSFTDVMVVTLLIMLFFLFAQMTINSDALLAAELNRRQDLIKDEVGQALGGDKSLVEIVPDGNLQRFQFSDRILFKSGEAELLPEGKRVLGIVGGALKPRVELFKTAQVEGHTDAAPIKTAKYPSNWELSSARATSVVRFFQDEKYIDAKILSANGYAEFRPIDKGSGDTARQRNRRVELVLVYSMTDLK